MSKKDWTSSLTEDEKYHLDMNLIPTLEVFKDVLVTQKRDNISCSICAEIARKLGLEE